SAFLARGSQRASGHSQGIPGPPPDVSGSTLRVRPATVGHCRAAAPPGPGRSSARGFAMVSRARWSALAMLLCAVCVVLSLGVGRVWLDPATLVAGIFEPKPNLAWLILTELRLPRTVLGLLAGATLGLSGA